MASPSARRPSTLLGLGSRLADRRGKEPAEPRPPHRLFARNDGGCPVAVQVEANGQAYLPAHRHREEMRRARPWLIETEHELRMGLWTRMSSCGRKAWCVSR